MLKLDDLVVDKEFDGLLPVLTLEESERLEQSILKNGMLDPIKVWEEPGTGRYVIIDGHNRYRILKKHNISLKYWEDYKIMYADELQNRDEVKQWMLEQQLGRRNLSEAERYEIVQKFKSVFEKKAKENQSSGGKGMANLSKVNTRKEMAKAVGVSEGTYQKMDKVMQSDNEDLKQQLREKKVSVDKAYREMKKTKTNKKEEVTPQQQIENLDNRMNEIDKEISSLRTERETLMRERSSLFEALDIPCELKYEHVGTGWISRECRFYIEINGHKEVFVECGVYTEETPSSIWLSKVPEKYKNDFIMLWKKAHFEEVEYFNRCCNEQYNKQFKNTAHSVAVDDKEFYKKCFRILAKSFHPDNSDGSMEDMQNLNQLKAMWGI